MIANSGIGTQVQNVLRRLNSIPDVRVKALGDPEVIKRFVPDCKLPVQLWRAPIYSLREQFSYPRLQANEILLCPHYNAPLSRLNRSVVVLHDLIHLLSQEFESPHYRLYASFMLAQAAEKARRIITVSEYTRRDFVSRFPQAEARTFVNHNGLDHELFRPPSQNKIAAFRKRYSLPREFLLTVGIGKKHKNVDFVIRSLIPFWQNGSLRAPLVMAGTGGKLPDYIARRVKDERSFGNIIVLPRLSMEEMPVLYAASTMLIMPSLLEGFGFPVIEAMASGTPVLSSNAASLPEVGGQAAVYFDPHNPLEFTDALLELLDNAKKRERLSREGLKQAKKFSWEKHGDRLLEILNGVFAE